MPQIVKSDLPAAHEDAYRFPHFVELPHRFRTIGETKHKRRVASRHGIDKSFDRGGHPDRLRTRLAVGQDDPIGLDVIPPERQSFAATGAGEGEELDRLNSRSILGWPLVQRRA